MFECVGLRWVFEMFARAVVGLYGMGVLGLGPWWGVVQEECNGR